MTRQPLILQDLRLPPGHSEAELLDQAARQAGLAAGAVASADCRIIRKSVDARRKGAIMLQYSVELFAGPPDIKGVAALMPTAGAVVSGRSGTLVRPVVAGAGPAGLMAALYLALAGKRPLLIEQGKPVEQRQADVARFWQTGQLDPFSNVQFGEGGAGTFSDGKLTTGIKDPRCRAILEEFALAGAPQEILYLAKPHIGTDHLRSAIRQIREKIIQNGGEVRFGCRLTGLQHQSGRLQAIGIEQLREDGSRESAELSANQLILAIGHSARDTFGWLAELPVDIEPKPFSIGVRIEHLQQVIDRAQYGAAAGQQNLPPAEYKLACHLTGGRSVYTFCMCPGGQVVASASEAGGVVTNGMSQFARDQVNANSALLVGVEPADFPEPGPLGGMHWQQQLERQAFLCGGGHFKAPAQRAGEFLRISHGRSRISEAVLQPTYLPGVTWCDLADCLPAFIRSSLIEALPLLDRKLPGFAADDAILTGLETRSSSPLRIRRASNLQASIAGLYPCGEGAGYAGGIMSAAADGLRCAESLLLQD